MAGLFVAHHQIHAGGCVTEARWASQNDEVYDRELEVNRWPASASPFAILSG
jgi:hypothetical protein